MTDQDKALFEASSLLHAYAIRLGNVIQSGNDQELLPAIEQLKVKAQAYLNLPRPQQKAA